MGADPTDMALMDDYGLGFANYIYNNAVDISRPPSLVGRLSEKRLGQHQARSESPKLPDELLEANSEGRETDGGISQFEMGSEADGEGLSPVNLFSQGPSPRDPRVRPDAPIDAALKEILREAEMSDDVDQLAAAQSPNTFRGGGGDLGNLQEPPGSAPGRLSGRASISR